MLLLRHRNADFFSTKAKKPTGPIEIDRDSPMALGLQVVWRFGVDGIYPVAGSLPKGNPSLTNSGAGASFITGGGGAGITFQATTSYIDAGFKPSAIGFDGAKARTVFVHCSQPNTAETNHAPFLSMGTTAGTGTYFAVDRQGYRLYEFRLWNIDFTATTELGSSGGAYDDVYVVFTYDGATVAIYGAISGVHGAMISLGSASKSLNTSDTNNVRIGTGAASETGLNLNTYQIGCISGIAWSQADATRWFQDPYGWARPIGSRVWGVAANDPPPATSTTIFTWLGMSPVYPLLGAWGLKALQAMKENAQTARRKFLTGRW